MPKNQKTIRLVSWNCFGSLSGENKVSFITNLKPDILIAQETREADLGVNKCFWATNQEDKRNPKGLGAYCFNKEIEISVTPKNNDFEILQPLEIHTKKLNLNLMAIWAYNKRSQGIYKGKRGMVLDALNFYKDHLNKHFLWIGDFNNGPTIQNGKYWQPIKEVFLKNDMCEVTFPGGPNTHRNNKGTDHHIDHCFTGSSLIGLMTTQPRMSFEDVPSDHIPLVIDIDIS